MTRLLYELRARFGEGAFQEQFQKVRRERAGLSFGDAHVESLAMTFSVQSAVIRKYGFAASSKGLSEMRDESLWWTLQTGDVVIAKLRQDVYDLIDMSPPRRQRKWHDSKISVPTFHTVGDSHAAHGWPHPVVTHYIGSKLCWNIAHVSLDDLQPPLREGDALCFCFGEIDCRAHVGKHVKSEGKTYQKVIDEIVARYFEYLRKEVPRLPKGVSVFVYNVLPPVGENVMYHRDGLMAYPYVGTSEERLSYVRYFNWRLAIECNRVGYTFFDVYSAYADGEGYLREELSDGGVHVKCGRPLMEFMERNLRMVDEGARIAQLDSMAIIRGGGP